MEDADVVLDKEIEELALDRPPSSILALGGSETAAEDIFKDVDKVENDYDAVVSSRLATCVIDKPLSCQDGTFDPLSSSEKNFDVGNSVSETVPSECTVDASDNDIVEIHSPELIIPDTIHVVSSSTQLSPHLPNIIEFKPDKEAPVYNRNKHNLVSCLKGAEKNSDKNEARCVQFSDEPGIVTEFIEPVNPWRDMRTPSKGEVISFYKNVCQKMKCKPLDKVIKQIQDLPDLSARSGTLVLRGCRLDNRSCEALESVFRRVQFENLDLENCSLEEDGATAILEMIEFYHSTCKLNIACNPKIGLRGWQALCRMLRKTPCLTYLDARRTILTEMTMPTFGRCLKADPYLKVLHLEGVFLSGRPLLILTTALKYNRLLEELYLGDNDLTSSDGPSLGAMLTYNTTLQLLDLRNNQLKDIGLAHIGNGLSDQSEQPCGGLCSLITWNNGLTHEGMSYLCEALVKTTTLKALNLGQNRIGDLGVQKLKPGLIKNKSLRKLGFLNTKLGSEGAVALAEVLADSWSITRIDIRENNVQTAGLMAFAMALKVNQSLLRLDLDKDIRKEPGMETVMQSVLVDIYNLCYRNKQLVRRSITPSLSASTHSISTSISRQSSTSSEVNEPFSFDDVFHPETQNQDIAPFSPVSETPVDPNVGIIFNSVNKVNPGKLETDYTPSTESLGNSISPVFESSKRIRAYSDPVRKNPDPALNERRTSRFSVTKILDSLGTHAAGVANKIAQMDNKLKKQHSKEKTENKSSELMPVLDQNQPIELSQFKPQPESNHHQTQPGQASQLTDDGNNSTVNDSVTKVNPQDILKEEGVNSTEDNLHQDDIHQSTHTSEKPCSETPSYIQTDDCVPSTLEVGLSVEGDANKTDMDNSNAGENIDIEEVPPSAAAADIIDIEHIDININAVNNDDNGKNEVKSEQDMEQNESDDCTSVKTNSISENAHEKNLTKELEDEKTCDNLDSVESNSLLERVLDNADTKMLSYCTTTLESTDDNSNMKSINVNKLGIEQEEDSTDEIKYISEGYDYESSSKEPETFNIHDNINNNPSVENHINVEEIMPDIILNEKVEAAAGQLDTGDEDCDHILLDNDINNETTEDSKISSNETEVISHSFDLNINEKSLVNNELNIEETQDDKTVIISENLHFEDGNFSTSLVVEDSFRNESLTNNTNDITNINPSLEYVKISESLNEEKSIYKP